MCSPLYSLRQKRETGNYYIQRVLALGLETVWISGAGRKRDNDRVGVGRGNLGSFHHTILGVATRGTAVTAKQHRRPMVAAAVMLKQHLVDASRGAY